MYRKRKWRGNKCCETFHLWSARRFLVYEFNTKQGSRRARKTQSFFLCPKNADSSHLGMVEQYANAQIPISICYCRLRHTHTLTSLLLLQLTIGKRQWKARMGLSCRDWRHLRIFNRLHVLGNEISVSDIDGMKILKLYEHPEIRPQIEVIKTHVLCKTSLHSSLIESHQQRHGLRE